MALGRSGLKFFRIQLRRVMQSSKEVFNDDDVQYTPLTLFFFVHPTGGRIGENPENRSAQRCAVVLVQQTLVAGEFC
jgi:hypothetical protein